MSSFVDSNIWLMFISSIICQTSAVSYNQPKFSSCASWNSNATTFANITMTSQHPNAIFVNTDNTVYVGDLTQNQILIWLEGSINFTKKISTDSNALSSLFVTVTGDLYADNGDSNHQADKWTSNATNSTPAMYVDTKCYSLFVDINYNLYCSMGDHHKVVMKSLNSSIDVNATIVAGTGTSGNTPYTLNYPCGIFVDTNLSLHVADALNNRIQLFLLGQQNGMTIAGNGISGPITLDYPTGIALDADEHLFIVDHNNQRIVQSGPNGSRCLVGCSVPPGPGSASNQLNNPYTLSFDNYGNIFVTDTDNNRIQKFLLATNSCDETTTLQQPTTSTMITVLVNTSMTIIHSTDLSTSTSVLNQTISLHFTDTTIRSAETTTSAITTTTQFNIPSTDSTSAYSMISPATTNFPSSFFTPPSCSNQTEIGSDCNISSNLCDMLKPCQNNGTCNNINTTDYGYICLCPSGFNGINCDIDSRLCKLNTCWNNGICNETSNTVFNCSCQPGWIGTHCETKINYCEKVTCLKNGVCRPLLLNFTCECLGTSYSGRYCEITATRTAVYQTVSKSLWLYCNTLFS